MDQSFYAVGIGASAGGLKALTNFFESLPVNVNASFIVVMHLMRNHRSVLADILSRHINLPIVRVEHDMPLQKGYIYVLIEDKYMLVNNGSLKIEQREPEIINHAIDIFMQSLAVEFKEKAVAIVLSGTGSDGLKGTEFIHQNGGKVLVQDPATATFKTMPNQIITLDHPDEILDPRELAYCITEICGTVAQY